MRKNPHRYAVTIRKDKPYVQLYVRVFTNLAKAQAFADKHGGTKPLSVDTAVADQPCFVPIAESLIRMSHERKGETNHENL